MKFSTAAKRPRSSVERTGRDRVAIALAVSWKPFVKSKASAVTTR